MRSWSRGRLIRPLLAALSALAIFGAGAVYQAPVFATGTILYVDGSSAACNDAGTGTPTVPYCTLIKATQAVLPGQTVDAVGGTYTGSALNPSVTGSATSPITFTASVGVTISGGSDAFAISSRSYVTINGFTISGTSSPGIQVSSSDHITISYNHVSGSGQRTRGLNAAGISVSGTTASLITHNTSDNNSDHGIILQGGSSNNTVSFNEASLNAEGWQRNANGINVIDTGSTGNTVLGNVLHDNEDSGLQFFSGANNGLGINNVSYNNGDHGIDDYNVTGGRLIGNTIYHNCTDGINVEGTSGNYTVMNNISVDNAVYPAYKGISCGRRTGNIGIYDSAPASTVVDYNFVYLTTSGSLYVWNNTSYSSPTAMYAGTGQEQHGIQADPKWISWTTPNFRLQEGSLAIDSANSGASGESAVDNDGNPRVDDPSTPNNGVGPRAYDDRGAYEFQTVDTQPPSVPTGLAASAPAPNQVTLAWNTSTDNVGVAGYTVYRNGSVLATVAAPGYTDASVSASTTYNYAVDAVDLAGNHSARSSTVSVTTPAPDTQPPSTPTGLTAPAVGASSVQLSWSASTDNVGVAGYTVYRNGTSAGTTTTTTFTDTGLTPATQYSYSVDAYDGAANHSAKSNAVTATTTAQPAAYVQSVTSSSGGRKTTITLALTHAVGAGDLLTGLFGEWDASGQVNVSDSMNGAWTRGTSRTYSTGKGDIAFYYLANSKGSSTGLTITVSASASTYLYGTVGEYSGIATSSPLDQSALGSGSGTAVDSGPTGPVPASELVFGAMMANSGTGTVTAGSSQGLTFTVRSAFGSSADADILAGSAGTQDARFTIANSVTWYALAAVFRPALTSADTTAPSTPTGLMATNGNQSVGLTWTAATDNVGVTGYTVYRNGLVVATVSGTTHGYTDSGVTSATAYTYKVDAFDAAGNHSSQSAPVNDTTPDWTAPTAPIGLTAAATGPTQVNLGWGASADNVGVTGYTVYRNGLPLGMVAGNTLAYSDTAATPSTSYSYTVDAFDAAGNHSAPSSAALVTTPAAPDTIPPTTPTGLAAVNGSGNVGLSWNASADNVGVAGYTVYRNSSVLATVSGTTVTYTDATAASATSYTYTVDAFDAAGNRSSQSAAVSDTTLDWTAPTVPVGLTATAAGPTQVNLAWSASADNVAVTGYTVYRNGSVLVTVDGGTLAITDTTATPSTHYTYTVDAFDAAGNHSAPSSAAAVTTPALPDSIPPSTPGGLAAVNGAGNVSLSWNASTDNVGVTGYTVYRNGSALATVSGTTLSYTDASVASATSYTYTVDAFDAAGNRSSQSAVVSDTTPDWIAPSAPTGLAAVNGIGNVSLSWSASTDNVAVAGYTVYRNGSALATVSGSTLAYTDSAVGSATSYTYTVDASDAAGNHSTQSAAVSDTTLDWNAPTVPAGLTAQAVGPTQVNLGWTASSDNVGVAGYTVYRNGSALATVIGTTLSYTDAAALAGTIYSYTVDAFDAAGNHSAQSGAASVTTPTPDTTAPSVPSGLAGTAPSPTQVNLTWNASTDNTAVTGYTVYRNGSSLGTVSASTLAYNDATVSGGTTYAYTVDAFDAAGNHSAQATPVSVTTPSPAGDVTPPSVPGSVAASVSGTNQVTVSWTASTDNIGVAGYTVYRSGTVLGTVSATTLSLADGGVSPGTTYAYTVDAFDAAGNHSAQSTPASVHVPAQIQFVQAKAFTTSRVTSVTVTLGAVAQGDLLVGWFGQYDSAGQVHVSDNVNGAWTRAGASTTWNGTAGDIALFYVANAAAASGGLTITITAGTATYIQGAPGEYSGVAAVNPLDQAVAAKGSSTSADSGFTPATGAGELVYGGMTTTNGPGTLTPGVSQGVGFVKRAQSTSGSESLEDVVASAAGQQHAAFTFTTSTPWFIVCAVFKAA